MRHSPKRVAYPLEIAELFQRRGANPSGNCQ